MWTSLKRCKRNNKGNDFSSCEKRKRYENPYSGVCVIVKINIPIIIILIIFVKYSFHDNNKVEHLSNLKKISNKENINNEIENILR